MPLATLGALWCAGVVTIGSQSSVRIWFNTTQAADHAGCHRDTVLKAVEAGELHGSQRKKNGRWRIHVDCLDSWCAGDQCAHQ